MAPVKWLMLPLRLFLGITFLYAGLQKLFDPDFLHPGTAQYLGNQLASYNAFPLLQPFLQNVAVPHAQFLGVLVLVGEMAIGVGVLSGFLLRPATLFGLLLNLLFFFSISWSVYPYFYGSDIVFIFCWLPLLLNGPLNTGLPTLDEAFLWPRLQQAWDSEPSPRLSLLCLLLGLPPIRTESEPLAVETEEMGLAGSEPALFSARHRPQSRRTFLEGVVVGSLGSLLIVTLERVIALSSKASTSMVGSTSRVTSNLIAQAGGIEVNSSIRFTIPSNQDPGILICLPSGDFVAYNALCTHANCVVEYNSTSYLLDCPCHGSVFDPTKNGAVVHPPATRPLAKVPLRVDAVSGSITIDQ
jgi:thiosulfate dehydrogenase (quinone) large subunit